MKQHRVILALTAMGTVAALVAGCGGGAADTTTTVTTTVVTRRATTIGAVVAEVDMTGSSNLLESPRLAVEFADGTQATAAASAVILEEVGLGADVLVGQITIVTWGSQLAEQTPGVLSYLVFEDDAPDTVVLEESSTGEWTAISVEG